MTLTVGTNTYVTAEEADEYASYSVRGAAAWAALSSGAKEAALVSATRLLERQTWAGEKADPGQALSWPRTGVTDRYGQEVPSDAVPQSIKDAQCELAIELALNAGVESAAGASNNTKRLRAGPTEVEYFRPVEGGRFPAAVMELVAEFLATRVPGGSLGQGGEAYGEGEESHFDDDRYDVWRGYA